MVERFDRVPSRDGTRLLRLMQEDFCQAAGTSPLTKYEHEGGPGLVKLFELVRQSTHREDDLRTLMASQVLFWMLRAPDGHAKNFSIRLLPGRSGRFRLTPLYDVMSALPVIGDGPHRWAWREVRLAMALLGKNRHHHMHAVQRRHFNSTARKVGYGEDAEALLQELVERAPQAVAQVRSQLPEGCSQAVADRVMGGLLEAARSLEAAG